MINKFAEIFNSHWDNLIIGIIAGIILVVMNNKSYKLWKRATLAFLIALLMITIYSFFQYIDWAFQIGTFKK